MPQMSVSENPAVAAQMMRRIEEENRRAAAEAASTPPPLRAPAPLVFPLCGGYTQNDGAWATEFEVRELTGRDEEALGRLTDPARIFIGLIERGLVRVGNDKVTPTVIDNLLAGDWETVVLAIRIATFGSEIETSWVCVSCRSDFGVIHDLTEVGRRTMERADLRFEVKGRRTTYEVEHPYGSTQRKVLLKTGASAAEMNSLLLTDSIQQIGDRPSMGMESVRNLPMADRKKIIEEIDSRRVGPLLGEVKSECPSCGTEQNTPLNATALFR